MFSNRALQVQMVKSTPKGDAPDTTVVSNIDPEQINKIAKEQVKYTAIAIGSVIGGKMLLKTVCDIATIAAQAKLLK